MAYERRVCVLRQVRRGFSADGSALTGAVYAERLGEELTVTPRIPALSPLREGKYLLYVHAAGQTYCLELKGNAPLRIARGPSVAGGFAALVCYVKGEPTPVAFGRCGALTLSWEDLLAGEKGIPQPLPPVQPLPNQPNSPLAPTVPLPDPPHDGRAAARYDDEAIAADDYFSRAAHADVSPSEAETGAAAPDHADDLLLRPRRSLAYYEQVRERLERAFATGEGDERLCTAFPRSRWVKMADALLGVLYEGGVPRYLCVAVEGERPAAMGEHACFVPRSPYTQEGFWVVFQDADTGEYVTVSDT